MKKYIYIFLSVLSMLAFHCEEAKAQIDNEERPRFITRVGGNYGFNPYKLESKYGDLSCSSSSFEIECDLGCVLPSKGLLVTTIYTGVGLNSAYLDNNYSSPDWFYMSNQDVDGDSYIRHYLNLKLTQKVKLSEISIPLFVDFCVPVSSRLGIYAKLGAKANINAAHQLQSSEGSAYVNGFYTDESDNGIVLDEHWDHNGFGNTTFENANVDSDIDVNTFTLDAFGGLGFRYELNGRCTLDVGASYIYSFNDTFKSNIGTSHSETLVNNTISGMESKENVHSVTNISTSSKRRAVAIHCSVSLSF